MKHLLISLLLCVTSLLYGQVDTIVVTVNLGDFRTNGTIELLSIPDKPVNGKFILVRSTINIDVHCDTLYTEPKRSNFKKL